MSSGYTCHQCYLRNGSIHKTAWIPSAFAKIDKKIIIDDPTGGKETWLVEKVYGGPVSYDEVNERSQDFKNTRKASDI